MRAWMVLVLSLVGCGDVEQAWDEWVDEHNSCEVAADCALVFPGCPLGCATAVNVEFVDDAEAKASRLIGRYERFGRSCDYDCIATEEPVCNDAGRCEAVFVDE